MAQGVNGTVDTLVGVDPVGSFAGQGRLSNVNTIVLVEATPGLFGSNVSDLVAGVGRDLLGSTCIFTCHADVTIAVEANHQQFEQLITADGPGGVSAEAIIDQTYTRAVQTP